MTDVILVNDDTTREDLILALGYLNDTAKRCDARATPAPHPTPTPDNTHA